MQRSQHVQMASKENWPGVKCDFSNCSSFINWLFISGQVSLAFWPGLPICKRRDNHICRQGLLSVRVIGAHPWCHFPVGNSHSSCFSHDYPGVRTRCFSFGNLFSCVACSSGPQRLFLTILAKMFWRSWNLVLRKDLTVLTVHLKVSQQQGWSGGPRSLLPKYYACITKGCQQGQLLLGGLLREVTNWFLVRLFIIFLETGNT